MKTLTDFDFNKIIIRVDFNVPLDENLNVTMLSNWSSKTIIDYPAQGGSVILMSHRKTKRFEEKHSLKLHLKTISKVLGIPVQFVSDCGWRSWKCCCELKSRRSLIVRKSSLIRRRSRRCYFAKELASLGDIYVNDAFELLTVRFNTIIAQFFWKQKMLRITIG
jgi:phosphoglycerate kinase